MKLSACYIVRNEGARLARSLDSLAGAADEVIVVDTGSTDDTVKIAEARGARVVSFPWRDDFAAARNASLAQATGDWIFVIDADEYFPDGMGARLKEAVARYGADAELLLLTRREIDEDTGEVLLESLVPRLLRRMDGLLYEGAIHEEPRRGGRTIERMALVPRDMLLLMHTGYSAHLSRAKGERNLALLLKELEGGCPRDSIDMYLAETYDGLGDEAQAMKYARLDVESGRKPFAYASRSYRILLRLLAKRHPAAYRERRAVAARAVRDFPELPEFHAEYAVCLAYGFDYARALEEAQRAFELLRAGAGQGLEPVLFGAAEAALIREQAERWAALAAEEADALPLYERAGAGDWEGLWQGAREQAWACGVRLFALLLRAEDGAHAGLLPPELAALWRAYTDGTPAGEALAEAYVRMLPETLRLAGTECAVRLAAAARAFSPKPRLEAARAFMEAEAWEAALTLLGEPPDGADADGRLAARGVCLFRLGDRDGARTALSRAQAASPSAEAASYLHWLKEADGDA